MLKASPAISISKSLINDQQEDQLGPFEQLDFRHFYGRGLSNIKEYAPTQPSDLTLRDSLFAYSDFFTKRYGNTLREGADLDV